jgi:hypothetical protein
MVRLVAERTTSNNVIYKEDPAAPHTGIGPLYVEKALAKGEASPYPEVITVTIEAEQA